MLQSVVLSSPSSEPKSAASSLASVSNYHNIKLFLLRNKFFELCSEIYNVYASFFKKQFMIVYTLSSSNDIFILHW